MPTARDTGSTGASPPSKVPHWVTRTLSWPWTYVVMGLAILALDWATGPFLLFPILFVLPVTLSAWHYRTRWAYGLAVMLPVGRFFIAVYEDKSKPTSSAVVNALVRVAVLGLLAYLVGRTARQTRELKQKYEGLVTMCAWSRTIKHEGQWISFEEYLERRFNVRITHGISPKEAEKLARDLENPEHHALPGLGGKDEGTAANRLVPPASKRDPGSDG